VPSGDEADALREIADLVHQLANPRAVGWLLLDRERREDPLQLAGTLLVA